jgi:hypothetical protein
MKPKTKTIKLHEGERVVAVVPERCAGPGWSNTPTWVYIATNDGKMREECIQPNERTHELHALFHAGEAMTMALKGAVPLRRIKTANVEVSGRERLYANGPLDRKVMQHIGDDMDERLEAVSEKIRMGVPVSMMEAIEAIDYQQKLKADTDAARAKTLIGRFMRWIRGA